MAVLYLHFLLHIDWNIKEIKMDLYSILLGKKFCPIISVYCPLRQRETINILQILSFCVDFTKITVKYFKGFTEKKALFKAIVLF